MLYKIIVCCAIAVVVYFAIPPYTASYAAVRVELPEIKVYAEQMVNTVFGGEWPEFSDLIKRESRWDKNAQNPNSTAYGLGQFLNSTWKTVGCVKSPNEYIQIECTVKYVKQRYTTPAKALKFQKANNWY